MPRPRGARDTTESGARWCGEFLVGGAGAAHGEGEQRDERTYKTGAAQPRKRVAVGSFRQAPFTDMNHMRYEAQRQLRGQTMRCEATLAERTDTGYTHTRTYTIMAAAAAKASRREGSRLCQLKFSTTTTLVLRIAVTARSSDDGTRAIACPFSLQYFNLALLSHLQSLHASKLARCAFFARV